MHKEREQSDPLPSLKYYLISQQTLIIPKIKIAKKKVSFKLAKISNHNHITSLFIKVLVLQIC